MLFCGGQHALKADDEEIAEQVGVNVLRSPAHIVLLKATNSFTNGGFDFSLGFMATQPSGDGGVGGIQAKVLID